MTEPTEAEIQEAMSECEKFGHSCCEHVGEQVSDFGGRILKLEEKLRIAREALEAIESVDIKQFAFPYIRAKELAQKALARIEEKP